MSQELYVVAALYKFVALADYKQRKQPLLAFCKKNGIKGTILLANEGINGTISGSRAGIDAVLAWLRSDPLLADLEHKESSANQQAFYRMKVKLKKEIVTMGVSEVDPNKTGGTYIAPKDWNALISDPDVILVDTRNQYEVDIGTFKNAIDPEITTFREFPEYVHHHLRPDTHTKIAMFCTGGIRCEKASSFMLRHGFEEVYHLKGGILKYLEEIPAEESLWNGECFVFDNRVSVGNGLKQGSYDQCHGCRHPISDQDKTTQQYQLGVSCPHCYDNLTERKRQRASERQHQVELADAHHTTHIGDRINQRE